MDGGCACLRDARRESANNTCAGRVNTRANLAERCLLSLLEKGFCSLPGVAGTPPGGSQEDTVWDGRGSSEMDPWARGTGERGGAAATARKRKEKEREEALKEWAWEAVSQAIEGKVYGG